MSCLSTGLVTGPTDNSAPFDLSRLAAGFADPVHDAQQAFRGILDAFARPGEVRHLAAVGFGSPSSMSTAMGACLLVLADAGTPIWLSTTLRRDADLLGLIRFHVGAPVVDSPGDAEFGFCARPDTAQLDLEAFRFGSDEAPQDGATLVIDVDDARTASTGAVSTGAASNGPASTALRLSGPGLERERFCRIDGPSADFWRARMRMHEAFPKGVDLLICTQNRWIGLPRSTATNPCT